MNALTQGFEGIALSGYSLDTQLSSAQHEVNQTVVKAHSQASHKVSTAEERQVSRDNLQQSEAPVTMVELFTHLGHTTRTVAKVIVQELEKEGVVRKIESSERKPEKW